MFGTSQCIAMIGLLGLVSAATAFGQELDDGSCFYNNENYPNGTELCRDGTQVRCEEGAWSDIGFCDGNTTPPPRSGGGDIEE
jgi:hypothetical protein